MRLFFVLLCIYTYTVSLANDSLSYVFRSGEAGYHTFRIPALILAPDKSLLAFCEARKENAGDFGNIKIVLRRSTDNGKT